MSHVKKNPFSLCHQGLADHASINARALDKHAINSNSANSLSPQCHFCNEKTEHPLCKDLPLQEGLGPLVVSLEYKIGKTIFHAGDTPQGLYSVRSGIVKLESCNEDGSCHTLGLYGKNSLFSYSSLFSEEPYSSTAICLTDVELCFFPKVDLLNALSNHPTAAMALLKLSSTDLKRSENKWVSQVNKSAQQRIAEAILFLDEQFPEIRWTRKEIAQWAGTTPETVIRTLAQFEKMGMIDQSPGRQIDILRREILQNMVQVSGQFLV